jgi:3-vinyl bacteriochlorophyllide hydratase
MHKGQAIGSDYAKLLGRQHFVADAGALAPPRGVSNSTSKLLSRELHSRNVDTPVTTFGSAALVRRQHASLYTDEQRRRRDGSWWTVVQGVLAPLQFVIFLVSLVLVVRYLATGDGFALATASIVFKTIALYAIMITGSIWEKVVFGRYLFAEAFFWEDVFSMLVLALHTAYLVALATDALGPTGQMYLALAAYAAYVINAAQFLLKLRTARLERSDPADETSELVGIVR